MLFNGSFISSNLEGIGNVVIYSFKRIFPGKILYDMFSNNENKDNNVYDLNKIIANNNNAKRMPKVMRRPLITSGGASYFNFKNTLN